MYIHVHVLQDEKTQIHTPVGMCLDNFVTTGMSRYLQDLINEASMESKMTGWVSGGSTCIRDSGEHCCAE